MARVRCVTIGYGFLGRWHAQKAAALRELCDLRAVVEKFPAGQEAARAAHPDVPVIPDWRGAGEIDAAVVVTPTSLHHGLVKELLLAGKHVFCEKPLCSTAAEAKELERLAAEKGLVLQVGHSERCHAAWESLRPEFLALTGPVTLRIDRFAPFKGRATDVDVVQDLMIHDIDLMLWLFGRRVTDVRAWGHKVRTHHWDHVTALFTLEGGMKATITVGRNSVTEVRALETFHATGSVKVDLFANKIQRAPAGEVSPGIYTSETSYPKRDHLLIEQEAFYKSILAKTAPMVDARAGREAVEQVEAVLAALGERHG